MKYYFLENKLINEQHDRVDPNPIGYIRIFESENIDFRKNFTNYIKFTKIIFYMAYERCSKEPTGYKMYFKDSKEDMANYRVSKEYTFDGFGDMFKTENFNRIFSSKRLAVASAKNMMNNLVVQFHVTLSLKYNELKREENRYSNFGKMLNLCKNKLDKIK
jgi:hypothetical protein